MRDGDYPGEPTRETLLVVDDVEENRALLARRLERRGYRTLTAASAAAALDLLGRHEVSLALLDVAMPGMDGLELLEQIRARQPATELPVIMVTARAQGEDILTALAADANDYVTKPIDFALLLSRIEIHLGRLRAERALRRSEERFALAVEGANDGIWDWDFTADTLFLSARWKELIGFGDDELASAPRAWLDRVHPDDRQRLEAAIAAVRRGEARHLSIEHRILHRDGSYRWMLARGATRNGATRLTGSQTDLTDRKLVDPVTGLPNRVVFRQKLAEVEAPDGARPEGRFALLLCNLDRFKLVNDSL